jgi:hypothetical protein
VLGTAWRGNDEELHVKVVAGLRGAGSRMAVEVDRRLGKQRQPIDTALLDGLAQGGSSDAPVFGVDVATHLQPELCLCMQAEEHHGAGWVKDDRAGGEVVRQASTSRAVGVGFEVGEEVIA